MDDLMMILGALVVACGVALAYLPAGVVTLGGFLIVGGVFKARAARPKQPEQ